MITLDEVAAYASSLPGVTTGVRMGQRTWFVGKRGFAWQRPFSKADLVRFGAATPPAGEIVAAMVESVDAKEALLAVGRPGFFTIPHFDGYPAVLMALRAARKRDVRTAIAGAWRVMARPGAPTPAARTSRGRSARSR